MSSLSVEHSPLYLDIKDIIAPHKEKFKPLFDFEIKLHTENKDLDYRDGVFIVDLHIVRNYLDNISDYMELRLNIPMGTFMHDVYDYLDNIEVTVITTKQLYRNNAPVTVLERYKAIYLLDKNLHTPNMLSLGKDDLNNQMPYVLSLQLLDRSVETLRIKTTQGNFDRVINNNKDMSISAFLKSVISEQSNKILIENKPSLTGIDIEKPDNKDSLKAITLPSGTRVIEIPEYVQNNNIGIYNSGVGCYIQKFGIDEYNYRKNMFIYSLYNGVKFKDSEYKVIFYSPITSSHSSVDCTYKYRDKILRAICHSVTGIEDNKETSVMSSGGGFRVSNANSFMKKPVQIKDTGPVFRKDSLSTEVIFKDRKDGLNFAPNKQVSGNQFKLTSELLQKNGSYANVEVSNIDHDYIPPGGKCKIVYESRNNKVEEVFGVIHKAIISYIGNSNPILGHHSRSISLVSHVSFQVFSNSK